MVTESQIQSIVDGECSHETRALLLREIDNQPSNWRTLALALLEDQQWAKDLKAASSEMSKSLVAKPVASKSKVLMAESVESLPAVRLRNQESVLGPTDQSAIPWLSILAASLLLGIGIYGGSQIPRWKSGSGDVPVAESQSNQNTYVASPRTVPQESELKMLVSGPNEETSEIPIYDLNPTERDLLFAREMIEMARINQRLRKEGYELEVRPEYYTGKLNDGRSLVVPVKHIGVRPYGL